MKSIGRGLLRRRLIIGIGGLLYVAAMSAGFGAVVDVAPGGNLDAIGTAIGGGAIQVADTGAISFDASPNFKGTIETIVWRNDANNVNGLAAYTIEYIVHNNVGTDGLNRLSLNGWATGTTPMAKADNNSGGVGNSYASLVNSPGANTIGFTWNSFIPTAGNGDVLLQSSLSTFVESVATVQDGSSVKDLMIYSAVPEPTTMIAGALLLLPFGASTLRTLRKNRTS